MILKDNKFNWIRIVSISVLIFLSIYMFFSFYNNTWKTVNEFWFSTWQYDSESIVIDRLNQSKEYGIFSNVGLLGGKDRDLVYYQQIGLQGIGFSIVDKLGEILKPNSGILIKLFYITNSILLTILFIIILLWVKKEFNLLAFIFGYVCILNSGWIIVSARNLYWVTWTFLLPFVCVLLILKYEEKHKKIKNGLLFSLVYLSILIRSGCGYEFISSIMIVTELPIIYYALKNKWSLNEYIKKSLIVGISSISGFISALILNIVQVTIYNQSLKETIDNLKYIISKRTGAFNVEFSEAIQDSLNANVFDVIKTYIYSGEPVLGEWNISIIIPIFLFFISLSFISSKYSSYIEKNRKKLIAFSCILIVGFTAPISWFILAKAHSYVHTHINYLLWSMPFVILGFCLGGANIEYIIRYLYNSLSKNFRIGLVSISIVIFILFGFNSYNNKYGKNITLLNKVLDNGLKYETINNNLNIYYYNNSLFYIANKNFDIENVFFLHIIPSDKDIEKLPKDRIQYGFDNYHFKFKYEELVLPIWESYKAVEIKLSKEYSITSIQTGQFNEFGQTWNISYDF